jgi:hypothetical protein
MVKSLLGILLFVVVVIPIVSFWVWPAYWHSRLSHWQEFSVWLTFLLTALGMTFFSVFAHNRATHSDRQHNRSKLFNECLAHAQLAFLPFYFALLTTYRMQLPEWFVSAVFFLMVWSLLAFYIGTSFFVEGQEQIIASTEHVCRQVNGRLDTRCKFDWATMKTFCFWNVVDMSISLLIALAAAWWVAYLPRNK